MRTLLPALAVLAATTAAAPAPDPLLRQLLADAKAARPVAFERTQRIEDDGKPVATLVDRYDPALAEPWKLVSVDGRAPKPGELADWRRSIKNAVPGYARIAALIGSAQRVDATHYRVAPLPKGFMARDALADHLVAEVTIDTSAARPYVREAHFYAREPFRMFVVVKIDKFDGLNRYAPGPGGAPEIVAQDILIAGSGPGMSGTQIKRAMFRPLVR